MTDSTAALTIESPKVRNCPKCSKPMEIAKTKKLDNGSLHELMCRTETCSWFNTGRAVQVDNRGNVYQREIGGRGMDKDFPVMSPYQLSRGRAMVEDAVNEEV